MMTNWLLYSLLIGGLMTLAGWQASRAAGAARRGSRWAWLLAGLATVLLPLAAMAPRTEPESSLIPVIPGWSLPELAPRRSDRAVPAEPAVERAGSPRFFPRASLLWAGASLLALGWVALSQGRLARERRAWKRTVIHGSPVAVSEDFGPAVVGIVRPEIVLPRWATLLPSEQLALVLQHEREHLRMQDSRILAFMLALVILMPWQVFLWIQLAGLRLAIELDCDNRVVRNGSEPEMYGELLLNLAERVSRRRMSVGSIPLVPFPAGRSPLERRIRALAVKRPTRMIAVLGLTIASLAFALACSAVPPASAASQSSGSATSQPAIPRTPAEQRELQQKLARYFPAGGTVERKLTSVGFILGIRPVFTFRDTGEGC